MWTLIYAGLAAYALWQWWDPADPRRVGWLAAASMLLNAAWILVIQAGLVALSVVVIGALLLVLALIFRRLLTARPRTTVETVVVDATFGAYLGWVCVATSANVAAALAGAGFEGWDRPEAWAVGVLAAVAVVGLALTVVGRGRWAVSATIVWGLAWIVVARTTGELISPATAVAAALAAAAVTVATVVMHARAAGSAR